MRIQFDFALTDTKYGVVEQTIFRLVLRGIDSAQAISSLLWIFSEEVKARALQKLVNNQILRADLQCNKLALSEYTASIINACKHNEYDLDIPDALLANMREGLLIVDEINIKENILQLLLPGINTAYLADSLVFTLRIMGDYHG